MGIKLGARLNSRSGSLRAWAWPIFGLSLLPLIAQPAAAGPVLPTGAKVAAGSAVVSTPSANQITVSQSSAKAIIDWNSFSISSGAAVRFDNGSGATLNRVSGGSVSAIDGLLSATGSVYLINPNGVVIGKSGVVNTGGTFAASTLDVSNSQFLAGGDLTFSGSSGAAVVNYGKIGSLGGDVALIAARVDNEGSISAANGAAGLAAGYQVVLHDGALNGGKFQVLTGGAATSATNSGAIAAAEAELRANGGNIYALAGDTGGVIKATGVATGGGKVMLIADGGTVTVGGAIQARGQGGAGGQIETSGSYVNIGKASIDAGAGGSWLLDPNDLTIDSVAAGTIAASLNAGTNVTQQTTASGTGGSGDITVAAPVTWTTSASLTLSAYRNIAVNANIASSGGGAVTLYADNAAAGTGAVTFGGGAQVSTAGAVNVYYHSGNFGAPVNYAGNVTGGGATTGWMLLDNAADLTAINATPYDNRLSQNYALNANVDISANTNWTPIGLSPGNGDFNFTGQFDGQNHTISGLTISLGGSNDGIGLFRANAGLIENLIVSNASVSVGCCFTGSTGVLAGINFGTIRNVHTDGVDAGSFILGGLVGIQYNGGTISDSSSSVTVNAPQFTRAGGLVGSNAGLIQRSYATGAVSANNYGGETGGLVGENVASGVINQSYATGNVSMSVGGAGNNTFVGGFVGNNAGTINQAYATGATSFLINDETLEVFAEYAVGAFAGIQSGGSITQAYATGQVTAVNSWTASCSGCGNGPSPVYTGFVGYRIDSGTLSATYFDSTTTGLSGGLTTAQFFTASNMPGFTFATTPGGNGWVIVDADGSFNNAGGAAGAVRPMLLGEYSTQVGNLHQLELMSLNPAASYSLTADIDASPTSGAFPSGMWTTSGFVPIGINGATSFTGTFDGQGHSIRGLNINSPTSQYLGLFGYVGLGGVVENVNVAGSVSGSGVIGLIAGENDGTIASVNASGTAVGANTGTGYIGIIAGYNSGTISNASAAGLVSGPSNIGAVTGYMVNGALLSNAHYDVATTTINGGHFLGFGGLYDAEYQDWINHGKALNPVSYFGAADVNGVYSITNLTDLKNLLGFIDVPGLQFKLTNDIDMSSAPGFYLPVVNGVTIDGAGHTVSNLSLNNSGAGDLGLFGYVNGTIENLTVTGSVTGSNQVGLVAGYVNGGGTLLNDTGSGTVSAPSYVGIVTGNSNGTMIGDKALGTASGSIYVGGVLGYYGTGSTFTNTHYNVDQVLINGGHSLTPGGLYNTEYQDWVSHGDSLNIANYYGATDANGYYSINTLADLKNILGFADLAGAKFKLTANIDLTSAAGFYIPLFFGSSFDGQGFTVNNISLSQNDGKTGFFGYVGTGSISNLGVVGGSITGAHFVGGLVGYDVTGTITNSYSTAAVHGGNYAGGLVGLTYGTLINDYATGAVSGTQFVGGLVGVSGNDGERTGTITGSYATGAVTGTRTIGGLVGDNYGSITDAYALGSVHANSGFAGGLVGFEEVGATINQTYATGAVSGAGALGGLVSGAAAAGTVTNSYWDTVTTGRASSVGGVGLTTSQFFTASNMPGFTFGTTAGGNGWVLIDADGTLNNAGDAAGTVRPMLLSEYSTNISNLHQLQLMVLDPTASYALTNSVDASATSGATAAGLWTTAGFLPVGIDATTTFTGSFNGNNNQVSGLSINRPNDAYLGLFGYLDVGSNVHNVLVSGSVSGSGYVSLIAGFSGGSLTNSGAAGSVTGNYYFGPIAGFYAAGTTLTNDHYDIDTAVINGGHAVTIGGLYDAQFQDWATHHGVLNITNYYAAPDTNGFYSINNLTDLKNMLGFADMTGLKFKLTGNIDLTSAPGFYIPLFDGAAFDGAGFAINNVSINQNNAKTGLLGFVQNAAITNLGDSGTVTGHHMVGGLVGYLYSGSISNSYSTATVHGGNYAGGLVGLTYGALTNDYATGAVSGTAVVGGLAGNNGDGANIGTITGSYATGPVTGTNDVGGLVGDNAGAIGTSYATGQVNGQTVVGGLVGWAESTSAITQSYATSNVSGVSALGGLVGDNAGSISDAYATGSVTGHASVGGSQSGGGTSGVAVITGGNTVGGLVGFAEVTSTIDQTFSVGMVSGASFVGGLIGADGGGTLTNSYWDTQTSGQATSAGGVGQTTAQLQAQLPSGFDSAIWSQVTGQSFPYLKWQFANAPEVIGGTVYTSIGGSIVVGGHVAGFENGVSVGSATTGANGYYQILVAPNSINNADLYTYLTSGPAGNSAATGVTGSITDLNIYEGVLYAKTADTSLTALVGGINHAIGGNTGSQLIYSPADGLTPGDGLRIATSGAFAVDGAIDANTVRIEAGGNLTIGSSGSVNSDGAGDSLILVANGAFINNAGASAVTVSNDAGRWLIYSQATNSHGAAPTGDSFGGLAGTSYYGDGYHYADLPTDGFVSEPGAGNRFVYGYQPTLTITAATGSTAYNGSTQTDAYSVQGLQNGDTAAAAVQGTFTTSSKNVGAYTFSAGLASSENYALQYVPGTLTITPLAVTLSGLSATDKIYDGTTLDSLTGSATDQGVLGGDSVTLSGTAVGAFSDQHAGVGKTVTVGGLSLTGSDAADYVLQPLTLTATITAKSVTAALSDTIEKTYDGTKSAALGSSDMQIIGEVASDVTAGSVSVSGVAVYATKNVGTGIVVTVGAATLSGASAQDYVLTGRSFSGAVGIIDAKAVTASLTGTVSKTYDGTTAATLAVANYTLSGVVSGDTVSLSGPASGAYAQKDVGTGLNVTVTGAALTGSGASNYVLTDPTIVGAVGKITPVTVTDSLTGSVTKTYDGTTAATLTNANYSLSGVIGDDGVTLNNPTAGVYASATAGARAVTVSGLTLLNNAAGDYVLASTTLSGNVGLINAKQVTASFNGTVEKTYDGTTAATLTSGNTVLVGEIASDVANGALGVKGTAIYGTKNAGSGLLVSVTAASLTGADAVDYVLASTSFSSNVGTIDAKALTASLTGVVAKVYDGTTVATLGAGNYHLAGAIGGDSVGLNDPTTGTYAQKDVGTGLGVTVTGAGLTGSDAGNYVLSSATISASIGKITPATVVDTLVGTITKTYDGSNTATLAAANYSVSGIVAGDGVTLNDPTSGTYASANAGNRTVTVSGLALLNNAAGDYVLKSSTLTDTSGVINQKVLTASLVGVVDKTYDTTTTATLAAGNYSLTGGVIAGDSVTLNDPAKGAYATKDAGSGILVTVSGLKLGGASASNYMIANTSISGAVGEIDAKVLTATLNGNVSRVYDATRIATLSSSNFKLTGAYASDGITLGAPTTGTFDTKDVGSGKTITASGLTLGNNAAGDYVLASTTVTTATGIITPYPLTVTLKTPVAKAYDGTTIALLTPANYALVTPFAGDTVLLNNPTNGTYASKGSPSVTTTGIKVTVTGLVLSGADANDYKLASTTVTGNVGTITNTLKPK
jgi:filamentous hemagglutinin family protein